MNQNQIKAFIAEKVPEGYSLSKIQDMLKEQNVHITFMELRLLASEIEENVWKKTEKEEPAPEPAPAEPIPTEENVVPAEPADLPEEAAPETLPAENENADGKVRGKTVVEVSKIARPGAVASGTVKFGSGVTAEWILDQMGRLGLDNPSGKPDQQDIQEFQVELQKAFS